MFIAGIEMINWEMRFLTMERNREQYETTRFDTRLVIRTGKSARLGMSSNELALFLGGERLAFFFSESLSQDEMRKINSEYFCESISYVKNQKTARVHTRKNILQIFLAKNAS